MDFYFKRSYFWLVYIRRCSRRLFKEIFPYLRLESFSFFFFYVGLIQPTALKAGKFGFFPSPAERLYLRLDYIMRHSRRLLQGPVIILIKLPVFFSFFFFFYFIALSRVYFTSGGLGGPEKDQILRLVDKLVSF